MGEIVNAAIICCVITLFGLGLGFVFLQVQANTWLNSKNTKIFFLSVEYTLRKKWKNNKSIQKRGSKWVKKQVPSI